MTEQEQQAYIDEFNERWTFGEPQSPVSETTSAGKIWQQGGVRIGDTVIVHVHFNELREAKYLGITNSFGMAKVIFEGDSEPTRLHYNQIGRYVTPELTEGQLLSKDGKFYCVQRKPISGSRYQLVLLRCEADGTPAPRAIALEYFTVSSFTKL